MAFQIDITDNATTEDTVKAIIRTINEYSKTGFAPELAQALKPEGSKTKYIKRLFDLVCENVKYERDPAGWEKLYTPAKLFQEAKGDCKKMSIAIASVLKSAGIEPLLKVISYDNKRWEHIYVVAKIKNTYYILDPVNYCKFNEEINHVKAQIYNLLGNSFITMGTKLSLLGGNGNSGAFKGFEEGITELNGDLDQVTSNVGAIIPAALGGGCPCTMSGQDADDLVEFFDRSIERRGSISGIGKKKLKDKLKAILNKVTGAGKTVAAAPLRAAFLGILLLGKALERTPIKIHLAQKMALAWKKDPARVKKFWTDFGGNPDHLKDAIAKGSGVTLSGVENNSFQLVGLEGIGVVTLAAVGAAITLAAPVLIAGKKLLNDLGVVKEGSSEDAALQDTAEAAVDAHTDEGVPPRSATDAINLFIATSPAAAAAAAATTGCGMSGGNLNSFFLALVFFTATYFIIKFTKLLINEIRLEKCR